ITAAPPAATSAETGASLGVSESAGTTDSTGSPTGTASAPTTLATCRPKLNLSPNLSPFWVLTVLQSVTSATDVSACQWADDMESLLLTLLTESQALSSTGGRRRRRFAENSSLRLQLVSATRDAGSERVSLVYYAMSAGGAAYLPADSVVSAINGNSARVPVVLGYSVESPAASVYDSAAAASSSKLWVIGAVLGCLGALLLIVWAVLFAYHKCLRPYEAPKFAHQHEGPAAEELEFLGLEGDGKTTEAGQHPLQPHPFSSAPWQHRQQNYPQHFGAKAGLAISGAEMDQLAERVAERLDRSVARVLRDSQRQPRRGRDVDMEEEGGSVEEDFVAEEAGQRGAVRRVAPPMREPSYEQPDRPLQPVDEDDDILVDAAAIAPRHQLGVASAASADRTRPAEKSSKKHEAAERKRNKKRLRRRATAERQARSGSINEGSDLDPALILPVPNSPDPTTALPQLCAPPATALRRSPYATGDAVARILPYLETDQEKHFNLSERDLLAQAELHHKRLSEQQQRDEALPESGRSAVLISVEPRAPNLNNDEWDLIRDSAAEDPRVTMLAALRREARAMGFRGDNSMV
uniref:Protein kinase domain-containing protein n=1 Tax=Macrostomum lignano TaxID=282301 RepID=A0A1I8FXS5_9PLAT